MNAKTIEVRCPNGQKFSIDCSNIPSITDLKKQIAKTINWSADDLKLVRKHEILANQFKLLPQFFQDPTVTISVLALSSQPSFLVKIANQQQQDSLSQLLNNFSIPVVDNSSQKKQVQLKMQKQKITKKVKPFQQQATPYLLTRQHLFCILNNVLTDPTIAPLRHKLIKSQKYLHFVIQKIRQTYRHLGEILIPSQDIVYKGLIYYEQQSQKQYWQVDDSVYSQLIQELLNYGYRIDDVRMAVEMSENNIVRAIDILENISQNQYFIIGKKQQEQEEEYLVEWFGREQNRNVLKRLRLQSQKLPIFVNSIKHRCPQIYQMILRHGQKVKDIVFHGMQIDSDISVQEDSDLQI